MKPKKAHRHRWKEAHGVPDTGVGAEWHYDCSCGAAKYVWADAAGERHTQITEDDFDHSDFAD